jgi:hypothetical protein
MAAMKLYYGSDLVGGEVDLDEFEQLKNDVEGKYDKGDPSILDNGSMEYDNAALMEQAVKGNAADIAAIHQQVEDVLGQLGSEDITVEFGKYFPKYAEGDDVDALMYDSAARMSVDVKKNIQDISDEKTAREKGDEDTLKAANKYTDDEIAKVGGIDGILEVEKNAVRNQNLVDGAEAPVGVMSIAVVDAMPDTPDATTLYVVTG